MAAACCERSASDSWDETEATCPTAARRWPASSGSTRAGLDSRLAQAKLTVASDVTNTLTGRRGAAATYGPQKGADPAAVDELDAALATFGRGIEAATGRLVADLPGAGAAGGTTAGLLGFTGAVLRPGVEVVAELVGLAAALEEADLVITGEGRADEQTLQGKTAMGVATLARPRNTPVVLLCGALGPGAEALDAATAITVVQPIVDRPTDLATAMADTERPAGGRRREAGAHRRHRPGAGAPVAGASVHGEGPEPAEAGGRPAEAQEAGGRGARAPR